MRVLAAAAFSVLTLGTALTGGPWGHAYAQGLRPGFAAGYAAGENDVRLQQQLEDENQHAIGDLTHWQGDPSDRTTRNCGGTDSPDNGGLSDHPDGDIGNEP